MSNKWQPVADPIVVIPLERPIRAFTESLDELACREPNAGDILRAGCPVDYDPRSNPPKITINEQKAFAMLERLTGVPSASLERMTSNDMTRCFWGIARFFIPELRTTVDTSPKPPGPPDDSPGSTTAPLTSS